MPCRRRSSFSAAATEAAEADGGHSRRGPASYSAAGVHVTRDAVVAAAVAADHLDFLVGVLTPGGKPQYLLDAELDAATGGGGGGGGGDSGGRRGHRGGGGGGGHGDG